MTSRWLGSVVLAICASGCQTAGSSATPAGGGEGGGDAGVTVILDGGGTVAKSPDGAKLCPAGACNYQTNTGCSGATPSCIPVLMPSGDIVPGCQPAGSGKTGDTCTASDQCAPGYVCGGTCVKLCCGGDWESCPGNEHCYQTLTEGTTLVKGAMVCLPVGTCDPLEPAMCPQGTACMIVDPTGASACIPPGNGHAGDKCPCAGGFACVAEECRRLCKAVVGGGVPYCQEGEGVCTHFNRDPDGVGECTP